MQQSPSPMRTLRNILAGLCVAAVAASAQTTNSITTSLTLEECIQTALKHNFDIQIKRYDPQIKRYNLNASYAGYDPTLSFSGEHDYSLSPGGIGPQGRPFGGTSSEAGRLSTGLRGLLPWGLTYDLGGSLGDRTGTEVVKVDDKNNPMIVTNSFLDPISGLTISQKATN